MKHPTGFWLALGALLIAAAAGLTAVLVSAYSKHQVSHQPPADYKPKRATRNALGGDLPLQLQKFRDGIKAQKSDPINLSRTLSLIQGISPKQANAMIDDVREQRMANYLASLPKERIDRILEDGFLKDIPIIGSVTSILRAISSTRDYLYYRKVRAFLEAAKNELEQTTQIPMVELDDLNRAGESCLLILDRISDISKSALVGRLFAALARSIIDYQSFHRLAEAVGDAYLEDLREFMSDPCCSRTDQREHLRSLSGVGLTRPFGDSTFGNLGIIYYEPTELAHTFLTALGIPCPELTKYGIRNADVEEPDLVKTFEDQLVKSTNSEHDTDGKTPEALRRRVLFAHSTRHP